MKIENYISRRKFFKQTALGLGAGVTGTTITSFSMGNAEEDIKLSGSLSVATIDLKGLGTNTRESRIRLVLDRMGELVGLKPDIFCLPEHFDTTGVKEKISINVTAEDEKVPGFTAGRMAEFAKKNSCYVVCPIYTVNNGRYYNSSLLIDRKGHIGGVYHKIHPSKTEMTGNGDFITGITPGALNQPVIETDFGKVGMQIGSDIYWSDGWDNLKKQGANVILFSSDMPGGRMLNHYALQNSCYIISSSEDDARIIDISGNDLHASSTFIRYGWDNINLKKVIIDTWPTNERLPEIFRKYGHKLKFRIWDNNWTATVESLDPDLKIQDVLKEFRIVSSEELYKRTEEVQKKYRL